MVENKSCQESPKLVVTKLIFRMMLFHTNVRPSTCGILMIIVEKDTIKADQYHACHMYFYPYWLEDNIARIVESGVGQGIDEAAEAQVKYESLCESVLESEARYLGQQKCNMKPFNEWNKMATRLTERLEYLE